MKIVYRRNDTIDLTRIHREANHWKELEIGGMIDLLIAVLTPGREEILETEFARAHRETDQDLLDVMAGIETGKSNINTATIATMTNFIFCTDLIDVVRHQIGVVGVGITIVNDEVQCEHLVVVAV